MLKSSFSKSKLEAGTDEAGRGCLAGPVVAAAVILPINFKHEYLNDSKKLSLIQRNKLRPIIEKKALAYSVSYVFQTKIHEINILNASILAMHKALDQLKLRPEFIIVDGNKFKSYPNIDHQTIVKGDAKYLSIAAASVLAKTYRDDYMEKLHLDFPIYNWKKNKGYPTKEHRENIIKWGVTSHHRKSFRLFPTQYKFPI